MYPIIVVLEWLIIYDIVFKYRFFGNTQMIVFNLPGKNKFHKYIAFDYTEFN